jgi:hypothetical protein
VEQIPGKEARPQREGIAAKKRKERKNQPQMKQPSREAMAGKLQIGADNREQK